jgi:leucyl aminopeptidase
MMIRPALFTAFVFANSLSAMAHNPGKLDTYQSKDILVDTKLLKAVGIAAIQSDDVTGTSIARITPQQEILISKQAHQWNRCGGFESSSENKFLTLTEQTSALTSLRQAWDRSQIQTLKMQSRMETNPSIVAAINQVSADNLKTWVQWFSAYPSRYNKNRSANDHVQALKTKIEQLLATGTVPASVDLIAHTSTPQKSIRVRLTGSKRPSEIIVLGGHMDSVNMMDLWGAGGKSPGADDNASGSANLLEALRILINQKQPERTVEIFLYAGEESGLLGSAEIAKTYKQENKDVIAVLQLDMTLFPGDGEFVLGSMTDFTSPWLRGVLGELNSAYANGRIVDDKCGYGCSDHASWFRQGYPTVMPFESSFGRSNEDIHTERDTITSSSNFKHSAMFSKLAIAMAMELGNSTARQN